MLTREAVEAGLKAIRDARLANDIDVIAPLLAPGATYRLAVAEAPHATVPVGVVPADQALAFLIDVAKFESCECLHSFVDGNKAAMHWRVRFSTRLHAPETMELSEVFEFDDAGKLVSIVEFGDTARLSAILGELEAEGMLA